MANRIAISREQQIFVVKETTRGTLKAPTATGLIIAAGEGTIKQQPSFTNSSEIRNSRDILNRFQDRTPPGDWSIPLYASPSGSAGTAPQEDVLMECLFGKKTVNAGVSVVYSLAMLKSSFSIWIKKGHTVFNASGATVGSGKTALATKDGTKLDFSGKFMKMGWAGEDALASAAIIGATTITVGDARKYTVGSMIEFVEGTAVKNNTNAGYKVSIANTSTNVLTITPGLEEALDNASIVRGWLPTGTEVGTPLESRKGSAELDTVPFNVQSMDVNISDEPKYLEDEITTSGYAEEYAEDERQVSGTLAVYFRQDDVGFFSDGLNNVEKELTMVVGNVAGSIMEWNMERVSLSVPDVTSSSPTLALSIPYMALGTDGEDSIEVTYK